MSYSIQRETSDGTLGTIDLTIEYIDQTDISVYVDDIIIDKVGGSTPYLWDWIDADSISITPDVLDGLVVMVKRSTPFNALYHIFTDSAVFSDRSMDENFRQMLYLSQEAIEGQGATDFYSDMDIHGYTIKNSGTAVDADDLVPLGQYQADASGAYQSRLGAEAARNAALVSQNAASASAVASANSAAASLVSENASEVSRLASEAARDISVSSASAANADAISAAASWDSFDDRYLGAKSSDPVLDNDGDALATGALYCNSTSGTLRFYNGSAWVGTYLATDGDVIGPVSSVDGNLALFNGVTGKLIKDGGTITSAGKALLDDADATAQRGTLGLGTASTVDKQTAISDATAGRLMLVGAGGLLSAIPTADLNTISDTQTGFYIANSATLNTPIAGQYFQVLHQGYIQTASQIWAGTSVWKRSKNIDGVTWGAWYRIAVTESPALTGVPTAPTAALGTNTTQLATTAFSKAAVNAIAIGVSQTWQDVSGSRSENTNYTNTTGKPIVVNINSASTTGSPTVTTLSITVDGVVAAYCPSYTANSSQGGFASVIVPNGSVYSATISNGNIGKWVELR